MQAHSAGLHGAMPAKIMINDEAVEMVKNENGHYRGLHVALVDPNNGKVEVTKCFDTHKSSEEFEDFISKPIPVGHIVVATCRDEVSKNLSDKGRNWFKSLGSKEISNLQFRTGFSFIGVSGSTIANERIGTEVANESEVQVSQIFQMKG